MTKQDPARDETAARATLNEVERTLREATLEVLWRQWSTVGAMASARHATSLVDPEALVLISLTLEPSEPRLADLLADWTAHNSDLLSVQRMRNLAECYPTAMRDRLAGIAQIALEEGKDHRWRVLTGASAVTLTRRHNKPRAVRAHSTEPAALVLRLRLGFGVSIKSDLLGFLLGTNEEAGASVSAIAAATGYTVAAVRKAARDLAEAHLINSVPSNARIEYEAPHARWKILLGLSEIPRWRGWNHQFAFVAAFLDWAAKASQRPLTPYVLESHGRKLLEAHPMAFRWAAVPMQPPLTQRIAEPGMLGSAARALATWMERMA